MAIICTPTNLFPLPKGAFIRNKKYVYINISNKYISPSMKKVPGTRGYTGHESKCIGKLKDPDDPGCREFYANDYYHLHQGNAEVEDLPLPNIFSDCIAVGLTECIAELAEQSGLARILTEVFDSFESQQILDLAAYMISKESAVMQHYPSWAREHALFSEDILDDTGLGRFLKKNLSVPKINLFKDKWMISNLGDGRVYLCYDSTNVNSQANGVAIVQMGHAKDDASLPQVNSDYVVRQSDGLPVTYLHSPGSVTDIAQAKEMIAFIKRAKEKSGKDISICLICDRGYISEKNLRNMDGTSLSYILMLRSNFNLYEEIANKTINIIKSYKNLLETADGDEKYGLTEECTIYKNGPVCYAQVIWSVSRYLSERNCVLKRIDEERESLTKLIVEGKEDTFDKQELQGFIRKIPPYFLIQTEDAGIRSVEKKKRGKGQGTKIEEVPVVKITGFDEDEEGINQEIQKAGIMILVTREKLTAQETLDGYSKRDCVEKVFEALKSHLGMDKIGVTTEEAIHGKGFVWFIASILHALIFNGTQTLRATDKKHYTVPAMVDELEAIKGDKDLSSGKYRRRYRLTARQKKILKPWGIEEKHIDERIELLV